MLHRFSIKIGGASGTGINTVGMILSRALKRIGFFTFAYREYPSLIKGGYASYKIEFSDSELNSTSKYADINIAIDKASFTHLAKEAEASTIFIYDSDVIQLREDDMAILKEKNIQVFSLPLSSKAKEVGGDVIMTNSILIGAVWNLLGLSPEIITKAVIDVFNKTKEIEENNKKCTIAGFKFLDTQTKLLERFKPQEFANKRISITGNEAISFGAIASGVRAYFAYPMTPSSSILHVLAKYADKTGMVVKQAEDEITAANLTLGANHAGTRAMTATSGGGFDLMTESVSLSGMTETPFVVVLGQRPGPATGMPTWTAQSDLNIAIYGGHGEFPRIVLAPGDADECFYLTAQAHNLAEKYQTVVIILTDKYIGESIYSTDKFDNNKIKIERGKMLFENFDKEKERYEYTEDGVSERWLPGDRANTFIANSDEHDIHGNSIEDAILTKKIIEKRLRKEKSIMDSIPEPIIYGTDNADISFVGWGSTKHIILDAMDELERQGKKINFLHYSYVYPLKVQTLSKFAAKAKKLILVENNATGQFGNLLARYTNVKFHERFLKYEGRHFFVEEIIEKAIENEKGSKAKNS